MNDDPLSDVLKLANVQSVMSGGFAATGDWAIRFPAPDKIKFFAAAHGACWLRFDGDNEPIRIESGDVLLLAAARGFVLASNLAIPPLDAQTVFDRRTEAIVAVGSAGDAGSEVLQIGGHVRLHPAHGALLADVLPPFVHVRGSVPEARALRWVIDQLVLEREGLPGSAFATTQLAHLLFVQALRAYLVAGGQLKASWLRAATDPRLAPALRLMHGEPGRSWRLEQLARAAAMSRTSFASYFRAVAGEAPLTYLARWRMRLAEQALRRRSAPVAELAQDLGYASESAFSHAFKRIVGLSPKRYVMRIRESAGSGEAE